MNYFFLENSAGFRKLRILDMETLLQLLTSFVEKSTLRLDGMCPTSLAG
jgi:hypothetical protein